MLKQDNTNIKIKNYIVKVYYFKMHFNIYQSQIRCRYLNLSLNLIPEVHLINRALSASNYSDQV